MGRRKWTFVISSDGRSGGRQFRMTREVAQAGIALALLLLALLGTVGGRLVNGVGGAAREHRMARENALLRAELAGLQLQVDTLRGALGGLESQDDYYRLLAGLDPLDPAIRQVGIGGPGLETLESNPLYGFDAELAGRTHAAAADLGEMVRRARLLSFSWREARDTLALRHAQMEATPSILPTAGYVSSGFSMARYHPILSRPRPHLGLDIVAPVGTPIVAAAKGTVRYVGRNGEYGLSVEVDHGFGVVTRYAHASKTLVRRGQPVERGDLIAHVGRTGLTVGPHLHYEVLVNGRHADPRRYIFEAAARTN
jgi:murein DD-endopeptidase MepM/ murein hydrolase activator NlpD